MPRQNNGTYSLPPNTTAVAGQVISPSTFDAFLADVSTEIGNSLDRLGRGAMSAALAMGGFPINGVARGSVPTDAATLADTAAITAGAQTQAPILGGNVGGTPDAITATFSPTITALVSGMKVVVRNTQTGNVTRDPTFQADATPATRICKSFGLHLAPGDTGPGGYFMELLYDAGLGAWVLLNPYNQGSRVDIGAIVPFASVSPFGNNSVWFLCNGQAISRTLYPDLFYLIGGTYGAGDGSTTFNVPAVGGYFIRAQDAGANIDPNRSTGSIQQDQLQDHAHQLQLNLASNGGSSTSYSGNGAYNSGSTYTTTAPTSGNHGSETRPKNIAFPYFIKAA